jgi:hypothetical protein
MQKKKAIYQTKSMNNARHKKPTVKEEKNQRTHLQKDMAIHAI